MPTGFMMALTFQTGNSAYLYLTVAFVQVGLFRFPSQFGYLKPLPLVLQPFPATLPSAPTSLPSPSCPSHPPCPLSTPPALILPPPHSQMLKAFCPVITMLLLFATRLERATPRLVASVAVISAGVAIASYGEMHLSLVRPWPGGVGM